MKTFFFLQSSCLLMTLIHTSDMVYNHIGFHHVKLKIDLHTDWRHEHHVVTLGKKTGFCIEFWSFLIKLSVMALWKYSINSKWYLVYKYLKYLSTLTTSCDKMQCDARWVMLPVTGPCPSCWTQSRLLDLIQYVDNWRSRQSCKMDVTLLSNYRQLCRSTKWSSFFHIWTEYNNHTHHNIKSILRPTFLPIFLW